MTENMNYPLTARYIILADLVHLDRHSVHFAEPDNEWGAAIDSGARILLVSYDGTPVWRRVFLPDSVELEAIPDAMPYVFFGGTRRDLSAGVVELILTVHHARTMAADYQRELTRSLLAK